MSHVNRVFSRYPVRLRVWLRTGAAWDEGLSADASKTGLFVRTTWVVRMEQVVQMRIELPDRVVLEAMGRVSRVAATELDHPQAPGLGIEFFAIAGTVQAQWEAFLGQLRSRTSAVSDYADDATELLEAPLLEAREALRRARESGQFRMPTGQTRAPAPDSGAVAAWAAHSHGEARRTPTPAVAMPPAVEMPPEEPVALPPRPLRPSQITAVHPTTTEKLQQLADRVTARELVFLRTKPGRQPGDQLRVALVHPLTDAELTVGAVVQSLVTDADGEEVGVQARFDALSEAERCNLVAYVNSGVPAAHASGVFDSGRWEAQEDESLA